MMEEHVELSAMFVKEPLLMKNAKNQLFVQKVL